MTLAEVFRAPKQAKGKRLGRGIAAGGGKTAGRGTKGQKARSGSGRKLKAWFEGGQTPIYRRLPKVRGFRRQQAKTVLTSTVINHAFKAGETVSPGSLVEKGLIAKSASSSPIKIVLGEPVKKGLKFEGIQTSRSVAS